MKQGLVLIVFIVAFAAFLSSPAPVLEAQGTAAKVSFHSRQQGLVQQSGLPLKAAPYEDGAVLGRLFPGDKLEDCHEIQNHYRKVMIIQCENKRLEGVSGWVAREGTTLQ